MPKTGIEVKEKRTTQYGGGWAKHAYGPLHPLSNRRRRHRDRLRLQRELSLRDTTAPPATA